MSAVFRRRWTAALVAVLLAVGGVAIDIDAAQAADPVDRVPPSHIRVCRSSGAVDVVAFEEYVRQVLPREFPPTWPIEALKAGAVAVKSYAWYYIDHPISSQCDIGDSTRYQKYDPDDPYNRPNAASDSAVRETFRLRLEDPSGENLYAQYCSGGCATHKRYAGEGRYLDQDLARAYAEDGWSYTDLLMHFYREMSPSLHDWRAPFSLAPTVADLAYGDDEPAIDLDLRVSGVSPGDSRASGTLYLLCTTANEGPHQLEQVGVTRSGDHAVLDFAATETPDGCRENAAQLHAHLYVKGRLVSLAVVGARRPWTSDSPRDVDRIGKATDPVAAGIALSKRMFEAHEQPAAEQEDDASLVTGLTNAGEPSAESESVSTLTAEHAVLVRKDVFADALSATALAGTAGPILFTDGGEDGTLPSVVGDELDRILPEGSTVHVVGGTKSVSEQTMDDLRALGFEPVRYAGKDRTQTAAAVADAVTAGGPVPTVMVARAYPNSSRGWSDAITVGAYAAATGHPILLTGTQTLSGSTDEWLRAHDVEEAVVVGGTASVSATTAAAMDVARVTRVAGAGREGTAVSIADALWSRTDAPDVNAAMLMDVHDDDAWPHALAAAVYGARVGAPGLAVDFVVPISTTGAWLDDRPNLPVVLVGSTGILAERIEADAAGR